jgi:hypothetical protein
MFVILESLADNIPCRALEWGHAICMAHTFYIITISQYGHIEELVVTPISLRMSVVLSSGVSAAVQVRLTSTFLALTVRAILSAVLCRPCSEVFWKFCYFHLVLHFVGLENSGWYMGDRRSDGEREHHHLQYQVPVDNDVLRSRLHHRSCHRRFLVLFSGETS